LPTKADKNAPEGLTPETLLPGHGDTLPLDLESKKGLGPVGRFITDTFKHFNAATLHEAAEAYCALIDKGGKMFLAMAGAMSTGEIGITLAEMIRKGKVHAICCTGANCEEDVFNLVAHSKYLRIPGYRDLTPEDEELLLEHELPRVTDTCIPEKAAMKIVEDVILEYWEESDAGGLSYFPHEYLYRCLLSGALEDHYEIDPKNSWMLAAAEKNLPIYVPGWEDSTLGNMFASMILKGKLHGPECVKGGIDYMTALADWYKKNAKGAGIGFFQIGGGIAGDFPICVVPLLKVDMGMDEKIPYWSYFVQISDSTTSYGSYSGAVPNEKVTWAKLTPETPRFIIESDASIVCPLMFAYILGK
jgi:deoxyhypusine synthase